MDGGDNVYIYSNDLHAIKRYSLKSDIEAFNNGYEAMVGSTDYNLKSADVFNTGRKVNIQKLIVDDRNGLIYAIAPFYNRNDFSPVSQGLTGKILYADDKIIITSYSAYLRSNNKRLGDLPIYRDNLYVDGSMNAYYLVPVKWAIKNTSIYEILDSLVNKTPEGESFNIDDYIVKDEEPVVQPVESITFSDISSHWAKSDIEFLAARQIVKGAGIDGKNFMPDNKVTRAEFVAMLVRALGLSGSEAGNTAFSDVDAGKWYYSPVMTASSLGLVNGCGNGRFAPDATITRQEIAALSARAMKYMKVDTGAADIDTLSVFTDKSSISGWARDNAAIAVKAGIMRGTPGGMFAPGSMTTRAEGAAILKRLLDYNSTQNNQAAL